MKCNYEIIHLPKEQWKGHILPIGYTTEEYYDVVLDRTGTGFSVQVEKKAFAKPETHTPEEYDFPDRLYADWWTGPWAWGILENQKLIAAIETDPEEWSNRLRITELWVDEKYQKQGIGHALIEVAREQARLERRRAVILETQSCNVNAVDFYLHEGFTLIGLDTCCYHNDDPERKEVRLEMGYFLPRKKKISGEELEIRTEKPEEYRATEEMVRRAFWNKYRQGCGEHYLVHRLREDLAYLPGLSRIAVKDGKIIGCILYSRSTVSDGKQRREVLTFGPLCVDPAWQGCGVGGLLLQETMKLAAAEGYPGIVILGAPDYYPLFGFKTCDKFGITTKDGKNFDAFMGIELNEGAMKDVRGKFFEAEVFKTLEDAETEKYNASFAPLKKQRFPGQRD